MKIRLITADGLECEMKTPGTQPQPYIKRSMMRTRPEYVRCDGYKDTNEYPVRTYAYFGMDGDTAVYREATK